jgi:hypothetical protein
MDRERRLDPLLRGLTTPVVRAAVERLRMVIRISHRPRSSGTPVETETQIEIEIEIVRTSR